MQVRLVVIGGQASKSEVLLELPAVIGRSPSATLTIPHPLVSRQHCLISEANGVAMLKDLDSLNGTFVGADRITEVPLQPGERFAVGPLIFRCDYQATGNLAEVAPREGGVVVDVSDSPWAGAIAGHESQPSPAGPPPAPASSYDEELFDFLRDEP